MHGMNLKRRGAGRSACLAIAPARAAATNPAVKPAAKPALNAAVNAAMNTTMNKTMKWAWMVIGPLAGWLLLAAGVARAADPPRPPAPPPPPSAEHFFRTADMEAARLSPSGRQLAVTVQQQGRLALGVFDLDAGVARVVAAQSRHDVASFHWVGEHHLAYSLVDRQSGSGDQRSAPGLLVVDVRDGSGRVVIKLADHFFSERARPGRQPLPPDHRLLAVPDDDSGELIVGKPVWGADWSLQELIPLRVNVGTLVVRSLGEGMPDGVTGWLFDRRGEPRLALGTRGGQTRVHWRAAPGQPWRPIAMMPSTALAWRPHSVDDAGQVYVTVPEGPGGHAVLKRLDLASGQPAGEPLVSTPGFDFSGQLVLADGPGVRPVLGVTAVTDAETTVWFDDQARAWQAEADRTLPGRVNRLSCRRCTSDQPVVLVWSWSDREPGAVLILRPGSQDKRWQMVGRVRRDIDAAAMATVDFHRVNTRDGQAMPVWLTLPAGADAAAPKARRPAVLLVHGGPWARGGHWGWDPMAQFLASRGYVVIEPEFRGSTGYGARWFSAGRRQWGQAMQDDLADALHWAVAQGWVDPARVCIAGASYGGYAALMGPIRHPALYRCAVSWIGVTDLTLLFDNSYWSDASNESIRFTLPQLIGDPVADAERLKANSPVHLAAQLKAPVLLAWGGEDRRVQPAHGERLRDALTAAGRPPAWVVYPDEAHGWLKPENRLDWARRLERFLAKHLQ